MNLNPNSTRYYSSKQEKQVAESLNGKCRPNSGATNYLKGDVVSGNWMIECKTTTTNKKSFSIKEEWLKKLREEAISNGKYNYALAFNFGPNTPNYYVLNERQFKEVLDSETVDN